MRRQINRDPLWALMVDGGIQVLMILLVWNQSTNEALQVAAKVAAEVPGLHAESMGLKGQLDTATASLQNYAREGEAKQGIINRLEKDLGVLGEQLGEKTDELDRLRPAGPVDIVILPDCTGSLQPHHERLKKALVSLFQWTPRLSSECRIGVLGFRKGIVYRYPLSTMLPPDKDGGKSQAALMKFMATMKTETSPTDHAPVFKEAFAMLPDSNRKGRKQIIVVLGDVSTRELHEPGTEFSSFEMDQAKRIVSDVRAWSSHGDRSVGSIFVGPYDPQKPSIDARWFQSLAQPAGQNFAPDSTELFNVIFRAIEKK